MDLSAVSNLSFPSLLKGRSLGRNGLLGGRFVSPVLIPSTLVVLPSDDLRHLRHIVRRESLTRLRDSPDSSTAILDRADTPQIGFCPGQIVPELRLTIIGVNEGGHRIRDLFDLDDLGQQLLIGG